MLVSEAKARPSIILGGGSLYVRPDPAISTTSDIQSPLTHNNREPELLVNAICDILCVYTSIKIIKNEVGCRDNTVPKTGDTRRHCEVELTVCNNLPQPPKTRCREGGCGRLLHTVNSTSQCLLVSPVFGTVSSLHPTSFLMTCLTALPRATYLLFMSMPAQGYDAISERI